MQERCGTCGFVGEPDKYTPHDCYWVFRARLYGKIGAEPGDVDTATQLLANSALMKVATALTGSSVYSPTCSQTSEDRSEGYSAA
jgi:hypothetical protein